MEEFKKGLKELIFEGLLFSFIEEKVKNYSEPTRKGTSRGEVIGFQLGKYASSLLMLTSSDLKLLSQQLRMNYGVLRKWRTEDPFKKQIEEHAREFAAIFMDHLLEKWIKEDEDIKRIFEDGLLKGKEEQKGYDDDLLMGLLDETKFYSAQLKEAIIEEILRIGQKNPFLFRNALFIKSYLTLVDEKSLHKGLNLLLLLMLGAEEKDKIVIESVMTILKNPSILRRKRMEATGEFEGWKDTQERTERMTRELINFLRPLV